MDYKIISADAEKGQIQVRFFHGGQPVATYTIDLPIVDGKFVTGEALETEIQYRAPNWVVERSEAVKSAENFADIAALVEAPIVNTQTSVSSDTPPVYPSYLESRTAPGVMVSDLPSVTIL